MSNRFTALSQIRLAVNNAKDYLGRPNLNADLKTIMEDMIGLMENFERITAQADGFEAEANVAVKKLAVANSEIAELKNKAAKSHETLMGGVKTLVVDASKEMQKIESAAAANHPVEVQNAIAAIKQHLKSFVETLGGA